MNPWSFISLLLLRSFLPGEEVLTAVPETSFLVISDTHYYDPELGTAGKAFENHVRYSGKLIRESQELLQAAMQYIRSSGVDLLLIPGDLTKDGALSSHLQFATYLDSIEQQGIRVFVVPGNHDVNNGRAVSYAGTSTTKTTQVGPGRFSEIYAAFAYDEALYRDSFSLSYIAEPEQDLWLIGLDACLYPDDHSKGFAETGGELRKETIRWLESHLLTEEASRKTKLVIMHHGVLEHFHTQARYFEDYLLHRYKRTSRWLASLGVKIVFTGHFHANDITLRRWKDGSFLYDVETGSLLTYPCPLRKISLRGDSMRLETWHIQTIPSLGTKLQEHARKSVIEGTAHVAERTMTRFKLNPEDAGNIAHQLGNLLANHCAGDEMAMDPPLDLRGVSIWGRLLVYFRKKLATGLVNDLPPADNQLTIHLKTGAYD